MVWFLERGEQRLVCEIRRNESTEPAEYVFELAANEGTETYRYGSPSELIDDYLDRHRALCSEGWRPCSEARPHESLC